MITVSRILIYQSESRDRLIKSLRERYVKGMVCHPNGDSIEEKFIVTDDGVLRSLINDMVEGAHGNG